MKKVAFSTCNLYKRGNFDDRMSSDYIIGALNKFPLPLVTYTDQALIYAQ